eukprot:TRINITY_DN6741_c0_g1_i1.p1 TRINITY_DN6741_c0_g1~~TRINITY_DN6741_c0_g1_i1.p1  ORF type:complete len:252 (+),score=49.34 TRINITY_DN6741_c0_g1_i1:148-903(+)
MQFIYCCAETTQDAEFRPDGLEVEMDRVQVVEQKSLTGMTSLKKETKKDVKLAETAPEPPKPKQELPKQEETPKQEKQKKQTPSPIRTYTLTVKRDTLETSFGLNLESTEKTFPVVLSTAPSSLLDGKVAPLDALVGISSLPTPDLTKLKELVGDVTFTFQKPVEVTYSVTKLAGGVLGFSNMTVTSTATGGLIISGVTGKAAEAGIKVSNRIIAVNGEKNSPAAMADAIMKVDALPGQETMTVLVLSYAD